MPGVLGCCTGAPRAVQCSRGRIALPSFPPRLRTVMSIATIESLDHEGRGVTHVGGKTVFIEGGLPGERVEYEVQRSRPNYEQATAVRILRSSAQRVEPRCAHFGVCGGCSMQHLDPLAQAAAKQRILEDALWHIGKLRPAIIYPAVNGPAWGYRYRARLGVRLVPSKGGLRIGFHERRSSYIVDMRECPVLPAGISALLPRLREMIAGLSIADRLPQVEIAIGDDATVFVFRNLQPFSRADEKRIAAFAAAEGIQAWMQPGGPDTAIPFDPSAERALHYTLPEFDVRMDFRPTDFTQVNVHINRLLIRRAMQLLAPRAGERIADLFCGLGNFTLPIARHGAAVLGIEGSRDLVARARDNAVRNGLSNAGFEVDNLFEMTPEKFATLGPFDKLLIDPPRSGAIELVKSLPDAGAPGRIVYVSCDAATLARDAEVLVHVKGYRLKAAGVANMFPHTAHVESIALFER